MKNSKLTMSALILSGALVLGACGGNDNDSTNNDTASSGEPSVGSSTNQSTHTNNETSQNEAAAKDTTLHEVEIEVDIDGKDAVDLEYDSKDLSDNEYKNYLTNEAFKGEEAKSKVTSLLDELSIHKETTQDDAIQQVMHLFNIDHYSKIEISYKYEDGSKIKFKDKKW